jgi:hypothetical protein
MRTGGHIRCVCCSAQHSTAHLRLHQHDQEADGRARGQPTDRARLLSPLGEVFEQCTCMSKVQGDSRLQGGNGSMPRRDSLEARSELTWQQRESRLCQWVVCEGGSVTMVAATRRNVPSSPASTPWPAPDPFAAQQTHNERYLERLPC